MTQTITSGLAAPFMLPCGVEVRNRFIKAAMTENLSKPDHTVSDELVRLYGRWGRGGAGVLLTGNVMVDRRSLEGPRNVAAESDIDLPGLRRMAEAAQSDGAQLWMQICHPGRQTPRGVSSEIVAPSAIGVKGMGPLFVTPRALTSSEIEGLIVRFGTSASLAKEAGFAGVQVHSAHGYLSSQFLSPLTNQREDDWGGTLEKRMRFLLEVVRAVRKAVGAAFPLSVKLNSADFQRGGFTEDDSMQVVAALEAEAIDLLEISGGNYERPMMVGSGELDGNERTSTRQREAYFLEYTEKVRKRTRLPLMLTGGLRTVALMNGLIEDGLVDFVGLARPFAVEPDFPSKALSGAIDGSPRVKVRLGVRTLDDMLQSMWHQEQMKRMARGLEPDLKMSRVGALVKGLRTVFLG